MKDNMINQLIDWINALANKQEEITKLKRQLEANNPINPNPEYIGEGLKDLNTTLNNQLGMMNETLKYIHYGDALITAPTTLLLVTVVSNIFFHIDLFCDRSCQATLGA